MGTTRRDGAAAQRSTRGTHDNRPYRAFRSRNSFPQLDPPFVVVEQLLACQCAVEAFDTLSEGWFRVLRLERDQHLAATDDFPALGNELCDLIR